MLLFIKFLFFNQMIALQKLLKMLLHRKTPFHSQDIEILVIFFFPFHTLLVQKDK